MGNSYDDLPEGATLLTDETDPSFTSTPKRGKEATPGVGASPISELNNQPDRPKLAEAQYTDLPEGAQLISTPSQQPDYSDLPPGAQLLSVPETPAQWRATDVADYPVQGTAEGTRSIIRNLAYKLDTFLPGVTALVGDDLQKLGYKIQPGEGAFQTLVDQPADDAVNAIKNQYYTNPALDNTYGAELLKGAGSMVPLAATTLATGGVGGATAGGLMMGDQFRQAAIDRGFTPEHQLQADLIGTGLGVVPSKILDALPWAKQTLGADALKQALGVTGAATLAKTLGVEAPQLLAKSGLEGGIQTVGQQMSLGDNPLSAQSLHDDWNSISQNGILNLVPSLLFKGLNIAQVHGALNKELDHINQQRSNNNLPPITPEEFRQNKLDSLKTAKEKLADVQKQIDSLTPEQAAQPVSEDQEQPSGDDVEEKAPATASSSPSAVGEDAQTSQESSDDYTAQDQVTDSADDQATEPAQDKDTTTSGDSTAEPSLDTPYTAPEAVRARAANDPAFGAHVDALENIPHPPDRQDYFKENDLSPQEFGHGVLNNIDFSKGPDLDYNHQSSRGEEVNVDDILAKIEKFNRQQNELKSKPINSEDPVAIATRQDVGRREGLSLSPDLISAGFLEAKRQADSLRSGDARRQSLAGSTPVDVGTARNAVGDSEALLEFARKNGLLLSQATVQGLDKTYPQIKAGAEHKVYYDTVNDRFIKITHPGKFGLKDQNAFSYLQNLARQDKAHPDLQTKIIGISQGDGGKASIVTSQNPMHGISISRTDLDHELTNNYGFRKVSNTVFVHKRTGVRIADAHEGNINRHPETGKLLPFDIHWINEPLQQHFGIDPKTGIRYSKAPEEKITEPVRQEPSRPVTRRTQLFRKAADIVTDGWKNAPDIQVYDHPSQIADPRLRARVEAEGDGVEAFLHEGKVYVNARNIRDVQHLKEKVLHEAKGHFGLQSLLGKESPVYHKLMNQVVRELKDRPILKDKIAQRGGYKNAAELEKEYAKHFDLATPEGQHQLAEEYLARVAETYLDPDKPRPGWFSRIVARAKLALNKLNPHWELSDRDVVSLLSTRTRSALDAAGDVVENGRGGAQPVNGNEIVFSKGPQSRDGTQWEERHGVWHDTQGYQKLNDSEKKVYDQAVTALQELGIKGMGIKVVEGRPGQSAFGAGGPSAHRIIEIRKGRLQPYLDTAKRDSNAFKAQIDRVMSEERWHDVVGRMLRENGLNYDDEHLKAFSDMTPEAQKEIAAEYQHTLKGLTNESSREQKRIAVEEYVRKILQLRENGGQGTTTEHVIFPERKQPHSQLTQDLLEGNHRAAMEHMWLHDFIQDAEAFDRNQKQQEYIRDGLSIQNDKSQSPESPRMEARGMDGGERSRVPEASGGDRSGKRRSDRSTLGTETSPSSAPRRFGGIEFSKVPGTDVGKGNTVPEIVFSKGKPQDIPVKVLKGKLEQPLSQVVKNAFARVYHRNTDFDLGETPLILRRLGAGNYSLHIMARTLEKIGPDKHNLPPEVVTDAIASLRDPELISRSGKETGQYADVLVFPGTLYKGNPVAVAIKFNNFSDRYYVNSILSIHPKEFMDGPLKEAIYKKQNSDWLRDVNTRQGASQISQSEQGKNKSSGENRQDLKFSKRPGVPPTSAPEVKGETDLPASKNPTDFRPPAPPVRPPPAPLSPHTRGWQKVANNLIKGWKNPPRLQVYDHPSQLPYDYHRTYLDREQAKGNSVPAFYDHALGTVYIDAREIPNVQTLREKILHESIGHYGLRSLFGDQSVAYNQVMDTAWKEFKLRPKLQDLLAQRDGFADADALRKAYSQHDTKTPEGQRRMAEELLARAAELYSDPDRPRPAWFSRIITRLKVALNRLLPNLRLNEQDIINLLGAKSRHLLDQAGQFVESGERGENGEHGEEAISSPVVNESSGDLEASKRPGSHLPITGFAPGSKQMLDNIGKSRVLLGFIQNGKIILISASKEYLGHNGAMDIGLIKKIPGTQGFQIHSNARGELSLITHSELNHMNGNAMLAPETREQLRSLLGLSK